MRSTSLYLIAAAAAISVPATLALADDIQFPPRKPGQWEIKMVREAAAPAMTTQLCLDAATDAAMMAMGLSLTAGMCAEVNMTRDGDTIVIDAKCKFGAMSITSRSVLSGDFQSSYAMEVTSDIAGAPKGMPTHSVTTQQATWVGECAADMQPGDMLMPGGRKINISGMKKVLGG